MAITAGSRRQADSSSDRWAWLHQRETRQVIYQITAPYMEELMDEIYRMIGYARSEDPDITFECIYLYGWGKSVKNLHHQIQRRFNIKTEYVDPIYKLIPTEQDRTMDVTDDGSYDLVLGLGMRRVPWL